MSCFPHFAHPKSINSASPTIKTDEELRTQREDFRKNQTSNSDFEIINKVYGILPISLTIANLARNREKHQRCGIPLRARTFRYGKWQ